MLTREYNDTHFSFRGAFLLNARSQTPLEAHRVEQRHLSLWRNRLRSSTSGTVADTCVCSSLASTSLGEPLLCFHKSMMTMSAVVHVIDRQTMAFSPIQKSPSHALRQQFAFPSVLVSICYHMTANMKSPVIILLHRNEQSE